jgi:hypothetical protein
MMTPVPPRSQSPLTQLTTSPRTCVEMIATASLHPQRRRRNHPIPAVVRAAPSTRNRIPTIPPKGASCLYAVGFRAQRRIEGRTSPEQSRGGETRHDGTNEEKNAHCSESGRRRLDSESRLARFVPLHLLNISQRSKSRSDRSLRENLRLLLSFYASSDVMAVATRRRNHAQLRDDYSLCGRSRVLRYLHFRFPERREATTKQVI